MKKPLWVVGIAVAVVFVGAFAWQMPTNPGEVAGWVQAFGSILAIGLAVWLQYEASGERQRQAAQVARAFAGQLLNTFDALQLASRDYKDHNSVEVRSKWQLLEDTLSIQVPLGELTPDYLAMVLTLRGIAIHAQADAKGRLQVFGDWHQDDVAFGNIAHDCRNVMRKAGLNPPNKGFSP